MNKSEASRIFKSLYSDGITTTRVFGIEETRSLTIGHQRCPVCYHDGVDAIQRVGFIDVNDIFKGMIAMCEKCNAVYYVVIDKGRKL